MKTFLCRSCNVSIRNGIRWETLSDLGVILARDIRSAWNKAQRQWPKQVHGVYEVTDA